MLKEMNSKNKNTITMIEGKKHGRMDKQTDTNESKTTRERKMGGRSGGSVGERMGRKTDERTEGENNRQIDR